ncbi:DUF2589 domain-containing protein [Prevotella stercorea]|uniref:DUF2589 domain-containing protein n=1 Tax=Leyella stercorea TaxID=363265 RepID=UPI001C2C3856|nr:DUF2589 domain-containing protein [Leyella stercorea]MBU9898402.1 DUF2589 domain-containing protein [Leyella stercorea]MBU9946621.1 DUF2589 domain-containing protein [Leyella stercorea]
MSDNENNNNDLMSDGGSSPPTDQVSQTDAPAVGSENNDTSSAEKEEEKPQAPSADNDKDEGQGQETEGGEKPDGNKKEDKNDLSDQLKEAGKSLTQKYNELLEAKKNDNKKDSLGDQMKDLNEVQVDKAFVSDSINLLGKISFDELIGNPLRAAVKAQRDLAKETLSYIREEGIKVDEDGQGQITYVTMNFFRDGKQVKMRVPLLTLMPVPRLSISTMSYTFKAKVNAMSGVVASVGSGGTPINAGMSTDNGSKSAVSAKPAKDSSAKGNNEETGDKPATSTDNSAASSNKTATSAAGAKPTIATTPTMSVGYSSKKDSGATRDSRYSVETTMDISITASEGEMPRGIDRLLGVLDDSTEVIDPKGTLQVSADRISLVNNYGVISVSYRNGKGAYAPTEVTCDPIEGEAKPDMLESGDEMLLIFKAKGVYMVSAGELTRIVFVS